MAASNVTGPERREIGNIYISRPGSLASQLTDYLKWTRL